MNHLPWHQKIVKIHNGGERPPTLVISLFLQSIDIVNIFDDGGLMVGK